MTADVMRRCTADDPLRLAVLISGSGTNLQALIDAIRNEEIPAKIVQVVSSRPDAYGIERAEKAGIPTLVLNREVYADPEAADAMIVERLRACDTECIAMAGYMRKCTPVLLNAFPDRVVNLHPALLPSFIGAHAIDDAYNAGVKVTGVTVHLANEEYDKGPIIAQEPVRVNEGCTLDELEAQIHATEHVLYPRVMRQIAEGRVRIEEDRHVRIE